MDFAFLVVVIAPQAQALRLRTPATQTSLHPGSPSTTTPTNSNPQPFEDLLEDPEYDQLSDRDELEANLRDLIQDLATVRSRAMAADFSEGRLETFVGSPQKELAGTQNQYVSYQVTTKVGPRIAAGRLRAE
ncbi:hypothetical protein IAQ61_004207 [Plenodomus lingam]|uniref:uncharacterized protein n=1 Tax=Leptosphaeria maculans TaxID=5022 RepID=UPI00331F4886|nr:hypothetical protein IAQ61_004207 [Plenodomus lingam]